MDELDMYDLQDDPEMLEIYSSIYYTSEDEQ